MEGFECTIDIFSMYAHSDDLVGGAEITGTHLGSTEARIEAVPIEMLLLNQGIETGQQYMCTCQPPVKIMNNFIVQVQGPKEHFLWGVPLRVIGVTRTSALDYRGHTELLLRHVDESH